MKKMFYFFVAILIFSSQSNAFNQTLTGKSARLSKSQSFLPKSIVPKIVENNVKWEETFNSAVQPSDWTVVDNDGSGLAFTFEQQINFQSGDSVLAQAGQSFWFSNYTGANSNGLIDEWLISPQVPLTIESGDSLVFYAGAIDGDYADSLKVLVSTTNQNPGSFTEIGYFKVDGPVGFWNRYSFDLSAFAGSQIYIAVNYYIFDGGPTGSNSDNVWVDHFIVKSATTPTSVENVKSIPTEYSLLQNYPNPFNPSTKISFSLPVESEVTLKVFNILGQEIAALIQNRLSSGLQQINFSAQGLNSGVYLYQLEAKGADGKNFTSVKKMILTK